MLHLTLSLIILLISFLFFIMNHPLSMGFILMTQTLFIALFSGLMTKTFWFSYSLFLIFMGGMLILFMYMTSLASNEIFKFSLNLKILMFFGIFSLSMTILFLLGEFKSLLWFNNILNYENLSLINNSNNLMMENNLTLNKMYNFPMNMITIMLVNYLFLTLIATVKITNIFKGPLRPKA